MVKVLIVVLLRKQIKIFKIVYNESITTKLIKYHHLSERLYLQILSPVMRKQG